MNRIAYEVIEHFPEYDNAAPEPFGLHWFDVTQPPKVGDEVLLKWLDGSDAYRVRVAIVSEYTVHVEAIR